MPTYHVHISYMALQPHLTCNVPCAIIVRLLPEVLSQTTTT